MSVDKTVSGVIDNNSAGLVEAGSVIDYNILVSNTGNEALTGVTVTDR